jgi:hypothetical protein
MGNQSDMILGEIGICNFKKCTRPESSPANIVTPSGATAQQLIGLSPVKVAIISPVTRFQTNRHRHLLTSIHN